MENILKVEDLTVKIKKKTVLSEVNLNIEKGKIYGLLGPNGAGKTTLLKVLLGVFRPTSGTITFQGQNLYDHPDKSLISSIGSIIEFPGFYDNLTLMENLLLHMRYLNQDLSEAHICSLLKKVGLYKHKEKLFSETSLGMKQRLGIARAMAHQPKLLLLDEPTNGLDPHGIKEVREMLIQEVASKGTTVIISSHLLNEIDLMADDIIFMNNGNIIFEMAMNMVDRTKNYMYKLSTPFDLQPELMTELHGQRIFQEEDYVEFVSPFGQREVKVLLEQYKIPVIKLEVFELSLEDLYLKLLSRGEEYELTY
ncbi:ABC transporter ATP-binding protein [Salipaludibacillus agaradhaerens]|uniref:ABC transporter ATP-binding protein n=1 Tax=Salipaludibacillus agaradhaerens TaxID=76935 RepID=UPI0009961C69|nr:ABC transporter ATP-binding protein [Salipaludibacillus agaradhaerens]